MFGVRRRKFIRAGAAGAGVFGESFDQRLAPMDIAPNLREGAASCKGRGGYFASTLATVISAASNAPSMKPPNVSANSDEVMCSRPPQNCCRLLIGP